MPPKPYYEITPRFKMKEVFRFPWMIKFYLSSSSAWQVSWVWNEILKSMSIVCIAEELRTLGSAQQDLKIKLRS